MYIVVNAIKAIKKFKFITECKIFGTKINKIRIIFVSNKENLLINK